MYGSTDGHPGDELWSEGSKYCFADSQWTLHATYIHISDISATKLEQATRMSLKHCLQMAYEEVHMGWDHAIDTIAMLDCSLKADQENLILVYGGSFNPPPSRTR